MSAISNLLGNGIDFAGIFPPAKLAMLQSVQDYAYHRKSNSSWAVGRYIVPSTRLEEFEQAASGIAEDWQLSVLGMPPRFETWTGIIDTIELKASRTDGIRNAMRHSRAVTTYFEIPIKHVADLTSVLADTGARAKVRTGGITAEMFPTSSNLAFFLRQCARAKVPFKATAGLHHPLRSIQKFTYEPDSESGIMHGFVNVFLAACLLFYGADEDEAIRTLEERSATAFSFNDSGVCWHSHALTAAQIRSVREQFAISFGSCSILEPIEGLRQFGWL